MSLVVSSMPEDADDETMSCPIVRERRSSVGCNPTFRFGRQRRSNRLLVYAARIIGIELVRERTALEARWSLEPTC